MGEKSELLRVGKDDNVMIGIKLDTDGNYLYVSTMHDIQGSKISRRLYSGRLREFSIDSNQNEQYIIDVNKYDNIKRSYFEVGNGSRRTLQRVPEMMDTPPIQNNYAYIISKL